MTAYETIESLGENPRPDLAREDWRPLDGEWDFALDPMNIGIARRWFEKGGFDERVNVPFCIESESSGVGDRRGARRMWYATRFSAADTSERLILRFGAADYKAVVWLNGRLLGIHEGGYTPFSFDLKGRLRKDNLLVVRVSDYNDIRIPRGKQTIFGKPFLIHYTPVSGIWQSVWLERVGAAWLDRFDAIPDPARGSLTLRLALLGDNGAYTVRATVSRPDGGVRTCERKAEVTAGHGSAEMTLDIGETETWSPDKPALYRLKIEIRDVDSAADTVHGYFGARTLEIRGGRITLNGEPFYQQLVLNQAYFPGGWYTPAEWSGFRDDVRAIRDMGFNGMRLHQKIENPRFLFWCDLLGLAVWEEMPAGYLWSRKYRDSFRAQWREAVVRDRNHPCVLFRVPFCESWGVHGLLVSERIRNFVRETVKMTRGLAPDGLVVDNSGFEHVETDVVDIHHYLKSAEIALEFYKRLENPDEMRFKPSNLIGRFSVGEEPVSTLAPTVSYQGQPLIISEYGGFGFYKTDGDAGLLEKFERYTMDIARQPHLQGYCYTQFTDVEQEANGLLELDRTPKIPMDEIRRVNEAARAAAMDAARTPAPENGRRRK